MENQLLGPKLHALFASQTQYKQPTACSVIALFAAHYLVRSEWRSMTALEWWVRIGCWFYMNRRAELAAHQTKHRHHDDRYYVAPLLAHKHINTLRQGLFCVEELSCVLLPTPTVHEFIIAQTVWPLRKALLRMFRYALEAPIAATYVGWSGYVYALAMRWKVAAKKPINTDSDDIGLIDKQLENRFLIDFFDSHSNDPHDGLLSQNGVGQAIWIEFPTITSLHEYLIRREFRDPNTSRQTPSEIDKAPVNAFDLVFWRANPQLPHLEDAELDQTIQDPQFLEWHRAADAFITRTYYLK